MKYYLLFLSMFFCSTVLSQTWDVVIKKSNYTSYFERDYLAPTVVVYTLLNGGGECDRDKFDFRNDRKSLKTATNENYRNSGWDRGHLVPTEDFAYNCKLSELTFRYYNCIPQHPKLNRGSWKSVENEVRRMSKNRKIIVMCINIFGKDYLPNSRVGIPTECIKLVWDYNTGEAIAGWVFQNNSKASVVRKSPSQIVTEKRLINVRPILDSARSR